MKAPGFYFPTIHTLYCPGERVSVCPPNLNLNFFLSQFRAVGLLSSTFSINFCPNHLFYPVPHSFTVVTP
eukprot:1407068-Rhodomonas_salina.1